MDYYRKAKAVFISTCQQSMRPSYFKEELKENVIICGKTYARFNDLIKAIGFFGRNLLTRKLVNKLSRGGCLAKDV